DALTDTAAERLLQEVLKRGGAVGGSAAGASILASYLVRGNPLSNKPIMAEGYEDGFGLLPGVAVDPHFTQRRRFGDMAKLKQAYPQLVGLGVDEETAIVVKGHEMEVVGRNRVCVFARNEPAAEGQRGFDVLSSGDRYDLRDRKRMGSNRPDAESLELAANEASDADDGTDPDAAEPQPHPALLCE
ncbi:MAG TPA: Type 1 glutamine amidotransferase-like domain-containing protein, partial [Planctomycetaceae bacterium]|nr:Type 1 glutamine amidotransferase-like domain-containing protein [Planctomycetaceae bacterium]